MYDVIVVGGGVIGMSIARELCASSSVLLLERDVTGQGTSWAAAGMLSPQSEADADDPFFRLCMSSLEMFPAWAADVRTASNVDPECEKTGLLVLAASDLELAVVQARCRWQQSAGLSASMLSPPEVLEREPLITLNLRGALLLTCDYKVTPRALLDALRVDCLNRGVSIRTQTKVEAIVNGHGKVAGVYSGGEVFEACQVVIAGGLWSGTMAGLSPPLQLTPRKGQILSITTPPGSFQHMIRWSHSYFVPRRDGEVVVGATNEDAGFDRALTPAGITKLLADAQQISSHVASFPICEMWTGLRPATPDGLPVIGESEIGGLFYATGHYRNGILLAPITASIIGALVRGEPSPLPIEPFAPGRFNV